MGKKKAKPKRDLLNLVVKLNDRNLQKKRESGITTYIVLSILIFVVFKIIDYSPTFWVGISENIWKLYVLAITINILICVFWLIEPIPITKDEHFRRKLISSKPNFINLLNEKFSYIVFLAIPITLNLFIFFEKSEKGAWYFITCSIFFLAFGIILIFSFITYFRKRKLPFKNLEVYKLENRRRPIIIIRILHSICILIILISLSFFYFYNSLFQMESFSDNVKYGIYILSIPVLIRYVHKILELDFSNKALEEFEIDIYQNDLSNKEIRRRLFSIYLPASVLDLSSQTISEIDNNHTMFLKKFSKLETNLEEVAQIDKVKYPNEFKVRFEELKEELLNLALFHYEKKEKTNLTNQAINNSIETEEEDIEYSKLSNKMNSVHSLQLDKIREIRLRINKLERTKKKKSSLLKKLIYKQ